MPICGFDRDFGALDHYGVEQHIAWPVTDVTEVCHSATLTKAPLQKLRICFAEELRIPQL